MTDTGYTAIATQQQKHPLVVLTERFEARKNELRSALPPDISPDRFIRAIKTAAQINPDLLACNFQSLFLACMKACQQGLLPDGTEGAIVPYKDKAQWVPMYRGMLKKVAPQMKWVTSNVVYEGDEFQHWIDENGEHLRHVPSDRYDVPIARVYAMGQTLNGGTYIAVLPLAEVNKIRKSSKASREDAPWNQWLSEMMKKTALKRLCKTLPIADVPEDDEDFEEETPKQPALAAVPRERGAAAALDAFAGPPEGMASEPHDAGASDATETTGETGGRGDVGDESAATVASAQPTATADDSKKKSENLTGLAYNRGLEAKAKGHQRKALPPEYRTPERDAEAQAWLTGWDGK